METMLNWNDPNTRKLAGALAGGVAGYYFKKDLKWALIGAIAAYFVVGYISKGSTLTSPAPQGGGESPEANEPTEVSAVR